MTGTAPQAPVDMFTALYAMRETVYRAWQRFVAQMPMEDLQPEHCWLLLQLAGAPMPRTELEAVLQFFADRPQELIATGEARGWIHEDRAKSEPVYELTTEAREFFRQLLPVAQTSNQRWREALVDSPTSDDELAFVLATLQGKPLSNL